MLRALSLSAMFGLTGCTYVYYPPAPAYGGGDQITPSNCREFTQTVTIDGRPVQATGHACRQQDGSWRVMQ